MSKRNVNTLILNIPFILILLMKMDSLNLFFNKNHFQDSVLNQLLSHARFDILANYLRKYPFITKLWQNDIDKFGSSLSSQLPSCQFLIHTDDSPDTFEHLVYPFEVKGITPLMNIIIHRKKSVIPSIISYYFL